MSLPLRMSNINNHQSFKQYEVNPFGLPLVHAGSEHGMTSNMVSTRNTINQIFSVDSMTDINGFAKDELGKRGWNQYTSGVQITGISNSRFASNDHPMDSGSLISFTLLSLEGYQYDYLSQKITFSDNTVIEAGDIVLFNCKAEQEDKIIETPKFRMVKEIVQSDSDEPFIQTMKTAVDPCNSSRLIIESDYYIRSVRDIIGIISGQICKDDTFDIIQRLLNEIYGPKEANLKFEEYVKEFI